MSRRVAAMLGVAAMVSAGFAAPVYGAGTRPGVVAFAAAPKTAARRTPAQPLAAPLSGVIFLAPVTAGFVYAVSRIFRGRENPRSP